MEEDTLLIPGGNGEPKGGSRALKGNSPGLPILFTMLSKARASSG